MKDIRIPVIPLSEIITKFKEYYPEEEWYSKKAIEKHFKMFSAIQVKYLIEEEIENIYSTMGNCKSYDSYYYYRLEYMVLKMLYDLYYSPGNFIVFIDTTL